MPLQNNKFISPRGIIEGFSTFSNPADKIYHGTGAICLNSAQRRRRHWSAASDCSHAGVCPGPARGMGGTRSPSLSRVPVLARSRVPLCGTITNLGPVRGAAGALRALSYQPCKIPIKDQIRTFCDKPHKLFLCECSNELRSGSFR